MKKQLFLSLFFLFASVFTYHVAAIHTASKAKTISIPTMGTMTVNDFIAVDVKEYRTADGKKLKWSQRVVVQMTQKHFAGKVKRGKLDGNAPLAMVTDTKSNNTRGLLSVIFSVVSLFVPYLGLPLLIAGFILGIIGLKKDTNPTLATIGVVLSSIILALVIIALISGNYDG